jgi:hypothetical protein
MADKKISALTASTTPLAGTEVLPIVQSGATVKVSVANLTAGRAVNALSVATTSGAKNTTAGSDIASPADGYLFTDGANKNAIIQLGASGQLSTFVFEAGGAGWRRVAALLPNGNSVVDVGNLVIGTSGKGIDFSATPGTGTSELFADYEEGTWTPVQGAGLTVIGAFSSSGRYTKVGRLVYLSGRLAGATSIATTAGTIMMTGLPFTVADLTAVGSMTNAALNTLGGVAAFTTTAYSTTTIAANAVIDFSITYSV